MCRYNFPKSFLTIICVFWISTVQAAVDSYRFMHVTISTPWYIFLFLLAGVFAPFILIAVLAWGSASRKKDSESVNEKNDPSME